MVDQPVIAPAPSTDANSKPAWQSKTLWAGLLAAAAPFLPAVGPFISSYPQASVVMLGALFSLLRVVTKGKVTIN